MPIFSTFSYQDTTCFSTVCSFCSSYKTAPHPANLCGLSHIFGSLRLEPKKKKKSKQYHSGQFRALSKTSPASLVSPAPFPEAGVVPVWCFQLTCQTPCFPLLVSITEDVWVASDHALSAIWDLSGIRKKRIRRFCSEFLLLPS